MTNLDQITNNKLMHKRTIDAIMEAMLLNPNAGPQPISQPPTITVSGPAENPDASPTTEGTGAARGGTSLSSRVPEGGPEITKSQTTDPPLCIFG